MPEPEKKSETPQASKPTTPAENPTGTKDEKAEDEEEAPEEKTAETKIGSLLTPEGILMMFLAIVIDLFGLVLFILSFLGVGVILSGVSDVLGLLFIGSWMFSRSGNITVTKGAKKLTTKLFKRLGLSFLGELIPFFGDIAPCWTLAVYFELRS